MKGLFWFENVTDSGSGIAAGRLAEQTGNEVKLGTEQSSAILGVVRSAITASGQGNIQSGFVPVLAGCALSKLDLISARAGGYVGKKMASQVTLVNAEAGGSFGNQPAGDGVEIVSDDSGDTTQTVTIYGTITGTTNEVTSETVTLTGTDAVSTEIITWQNILAVKLSAECAGTITIREASANETITTITTGDLSAGVVEPATTQAYGLIPRHDGGDSSTAPIAIIGTGLDGTALSVVDALNGTTEEDHGTTPYGTITEVYIGAAAVNVTILTNESTDSVDVGIVLGDSATEGELIDAYITPYFI